jgi:hypothetical protein
MFILRSAFWLTVAFMAVAPKGVDLGASAGDFSAQAMAAGQQMIVSRILEEECRSLECIGGKAMLAAAVGTASSTSPSGVATMQDSPPGLIPVPRPRPDWMG